jgi:hypothetical protein
LFPLSLDQTPDYNQKVNTKKINGYMNKKNYLYSSSTIIFQVYHQTMKYITHITSTQNHHRPNNNNKKNKKKTDKKTIPCYHQNKSLQLVSIRDQYNIQGTIPKSTLSKIHKN